MYKYILAVIIIAIFIGCSAPKPEKPPVWYTSPPQDFKFFYITSSGTTQLKAKNKAFATLRAQINFDLDKAFIDKTSRLKIAQDQDIKSILKENEIFSNTLSMRGVKVEKTAVYKQEHLLLIKLSRNSIFDYVEKIAIKRLKASKSRYDKFKDKIAIKRYIGLLQEMKHYPKLASIIEAKKISLATYDTYDEFSYLNNIRSEYIKLKKSISFYILSDVNSRIFVSNIKDALIASGLTISSKPISDDSLKLFITSKTNNSQNYSFNQSKTLIKYRTYTQKKEEVAFRQHTFIGKSRKSHGEAKAQSAVHEKSKIKKLGIYNFIGFK